ncbi:MAG: hypothetical protein NTW20_09555 [Rhodobacterales bacterium]|nr:hypothetical protein [Rhodobacterales bacterium]
MQSSSAVRRFDRDRFQRLLDLIGPSEVAAFLTQLAQDLSGCGDAITRAAATRDWATLREASHVLISLSGSVGAVSLQSLAEHLNAVSRGDAAATDRLLDDLGCDLSALLAVVRAQAASLQGPQ